MHCLLNFKNYFDADLRRSDGWFIRNCSKEKYVIQLVGNFLEMLMRDDETNLNNLHVTMKLLNTYLLDTNNPLTSS